MPVLKSHKLSQLLPRSDPVGDCSVGYSVSYRSLHIGAGSMLSLDEEDSDARLLGEEAKAGKLRMRLLDGNVDNFSRPSRASDLESQRLLSLGHGGSLKDRLALVTGLSEYLTFIGVLSPAVEELTCTINAKLLAFCWTRLLRMGLLIAVIIPCINMISLAVAVGPDQFHLSDVFDCVIYLGIVTKTNGPLFRAF